MSAAGCGSRQKRAKDDLGLLSNWRRKCEDLGMPAEPSLGLLSDEPVSGSGVDSFRRRPLAERLARLIEHAADGSSSTVFAVVGPWGSGKTSLLNFTREASARAG